MNAGGLGNDLQIRGAAAVLVAAHGVHQGSAADGLVILDHLKLDIEITQRPLVVRSEQAAGTMDNVLVGHGKAKLRRFDITQYGSYFRHLE